MSAEQMLDAWLTIESDSETRQRHRRIEEAAARWAQAERELEHVNRTAFVNQKGAAFRVALDEHKAASAALLDLFPGGAA
jgi:hypothetical protein